MSKHYENDKLQERYGKSEHGNFFVRETIPVPHPYCVGPIHVTVASKHHGGMLNETAIEDAERAYGGHCCTCKGKLAFKEHGTAVLVACKKDTSNGDRIDAELHTYLLHCKQQCEEDGFVGFAFVMT